jgi:hypothetical protein
MGAFIGGRKAGQNKKNGFPVFKSGPDGLGCA